MIRRSKLQGMALAVTLLLLALLLVVVVAISGLCDRHLQQVSANLASTTSVYAAEAGIAASLAQLKADSSWNAGFVNVAMTGELEPFYSVIVVNNSQSAASVAPDGTLVPAGNTYLLSTGSVGILHKYPRRVSVCLTGGAGYGFNFGLWGTTGLDFTGGGGGRIALDSYASSNTTTYPPASPSPGNSNAKFGADTGTVDPGNYNFLGQLNVGPSQPSASPSPMTGASYTGSSGQILGGSPVTLSAPYIPPPVTRVAGSTNLSGTTTDLLPGAYGALLGSVTIRRTGDYVFTNVTGKITIDPSIVNSGDVRIFIEGTAFTSLSDVDNQAPNRQARYCQIYCGPNVTSISTSGASGAGDQQCFALYAPNASVDINGNHEIFGAVVCSQYTKHGTPSTFHYDTTLSTIQLPNPSTGIQVLSWQRL